MERRPHRCRPRIDLSLLQTVTPAPLAGTAWAASALGAWLLLAPSVLGYAGHGRATANDLCTGALVLAAGATGIRAARRRSRSTRDRRGAP